MQQLCQGQQQQAQEQQVDVAVLLVAGVPQAMLPLHLLLLVVVAACGLLRRGVYRWTLG